MASFNLFLLTLSLFIILYYHPFLLLKADDNLITKLCSKTEEPGTCSSCLKADPSSITADARALAKIAIHCAEKDTGIFNDYIFNLYENASDASLKNVLDICSLRTLMARDDFLGVINNVDALDYDAAKSIVIDHILPSVNYCMDQFDKSPQLPLPSVVLAGTHIVNVDCNIVTGILNNI